MTVAEFKKVKQYNDAQIFLRQFQENSLLKKLEGLPDDAEIAGDLLQWLADIDAVRELKKYTA